jgi:hypothetical protein
MKASPRITTTAAAVLLATFGALGVALPAAAQPRPQVVAPVQRVAIERFTMEGDVRPGSELRFHVQGTPGVYAILEIPGIRGATRMTEVQPGVYESSYVLRPGDRLVRAAATLKSGTSHVTSQFFPAREARQADRGRDSHEHGPGPAADRSPPQIVAVSPAEGQRVDARGSTRITAQVSDRGTGIDSVDLRIDGRDVSRSARFEGGEVRYAEDLPAGHHTAELAVHDRAGNVARRAWSFDVVPEPRRGDSGRGEPGRGESGRGESGRGDFGGGGYRRY